jgi:DNA-binding NarL/FixJ family response regulator
MQTTTRSMTRVLIVDDHPTVRQGVQAVLDTAPDLTVCGEAGSIAEALRVGAAELPDLVLLDLGLPDNSGVRGMQRVAEALPGSRVLILSGNAEPGLVRACLEAGAVGYLLKTAAPTLLREAVRRASRGEPVIDPALVGALVDGPPRALTPRELEVLSAVSRGLTNRQAAGVLGTRESTVKTLLARAMTKLKASDRAHAVAVGLRRGLIE